MLVFIPADRYNHPTVLLYRQLSSPTAPAGIGQLTFPPGPSPFRTPGRGPPVPICRLSAGNGGISLKQKIPDKSSFHRRLFALVLPMAAQNLLSALLSASDALMLGFLDQNSLSAVSLASQVQFVFSLFLDAAIIGTTILSAQYWGQGNVRAVEKILGNTLRLSLLIGAVFCLAALGAPRLLMRVFTPEEELIDLGASYLRIVSISYLLGGFSQIILCVMKNTRRTLRSTVYASVSVVLNVALNALLIFGLLGFPRMGIRGAAAATSVSRLLEVLLTLWENRRFRTVRLRLSHLLRADRELFRQFRRHTAPVLANEMSWGLGVTMFSVIMGHLGSDAVAANAIGQIVKNIAACFCSGLGAGAGILTGNLLGAGKLEQARREGGKLVRISLLSGAVSGLVLLSFSPLVMRFGEYLSGTAREYLRFMLYVCSFYMIGKSVNGTVIAGIFCAGGDTRFGFYCDTVNMWCLIIPMGLLAAFVFHAPPPLVYLLLSLDEFTKMPAEWIHYHKYRWVRNLTTERSEPS